MGSSQLLQSVSQGPVRTFSRSGPEAKMSMWNEGKRNLLREGAWQGKERKQLSLGTVTGAWGDLFGMGYL